MISFDLRPVGLTIGLLLVIFSAGMVIPAVVDLVAGNRDWMAFVASAGFTLFVGAALVMTTRSPDITMGLRQAFLLTVLSWTVLPAFACLPFVISELRLSFTDAYFEAMSGITTTGATILVGLDDMPPGILLWRAILQWLGGLGIIIMALTILPMLKVGGMQMFKVEAFDAGEKVLPRATSMASALVLVYIGLTALWSFFLWLAGMQIFDAVCHAMTTIATGGYSTKDASVGYFDSAIIDVIITAGMIVGAVPFILYIMVLRGRPQGLLRDSQVRWFLGFLAIFVTMIAVWLLAKQNYAPDDALVDAAFNVVSVMTGTGYATADYNAWGGLATSVLFCLMFVGGCAGSTSCGIKIFRFQILYETAKGQVARLLQPHGVFVPQWNGRPLEAGISESVMGFFFFYALATTWIAIALGAFGLDFITALSGAASALSNVGPGLGDVIGPAGNYASLPEGAKWVLSAAMVIGRLELFTVMVLFLPRFWK